MLVSPRSIGVFPVSTAIIVLKSLRVVDRLLEPEQVFWVWTTLFGAVVAYFRCRQLPGHVLQGGGGVEGLVIVAQHGLFSGQQGSQAGWLVLSHPIAGIIAQRVSRRGACHGGHRASARF